MSRIRLDYRGRQILEVWWLCPTCQRLIAPKEAHGHR